MTIDLSHLREGGEQGVARPTDRAGGADAPEPVPVSALTSAHPSRVEHPSVFIKEEMLARGWNMARLSRAMGDDPAINMFALDMYFAIGPTNSGLRLGGFTAGQLSRAFGTSAALWLDLETAWLRDSDTRRTAETGTGSVRSTGSAVPKAIAQITGDA